MELFGEIEKIIKPNQIIELTIKSKNVNITKEVNTNIIIGGSRGTDLCIDMFIPIKIIPEIEITTTYLYNKVSNYLYEPLIGIPYAKAELEPGSKYKTIILRFYMVILLSGVIMFFIIKKIQKNKGFGLKLFTWIVFSVVLSFLIKMILYFILK